MRKAVIPLLLLILVLSLAIACSSSSGETSPHGTIRFFGVAPSTLDPAIARSDDSLTFVIEIFSGLVSFNTDLELTPELAERWDVSRDGKTYTFYLRQDAKFSNGKQVTAGDFKYSLERACDPSTGSQTAITYLGDIVGVQERLLGEADEISGVQVIDDFTLQITIDAPKEYFLSKLAHPVAYVVDSQNVESGAQWWRNPVGTGAFQLEDWKADQTITLKRNDSYYLEPPKIEGAVFRLWGGVPMRMYETDEIDVSDVYLSDIDRVLDPQSPLHSELHVAPEFSLYMVGFNAKKPPFDDARVRQAFVRAIDKTKISTLVLKDMVVPASGILPPGMPGYTDKLEGLSFDPELARKLLAESSYGSASNLPEITLTSPGRGVASNTEAALVDMWRKNLGVEVKVRQLEPEAYPYLIMEEKDEMFTLGWGADYPDPQNFLDVLFHSGAPDNMGEYSNRELDDLLDRAQTEQDREARMGLYQQAEQTIVQDAACLPLYFSTIHMLIKPYVKDYPLTPMWIPTLKYVSLAN